MTDAAQPTAPVATTSAPFPDDDPRAVLARAVALAAGVIEAVDADQLGRPTPCDGVDVEHLLAHLVMVLRRIAAAGRGDDPATWPVEEPAAPADGWLAAWRSAAHDVQAAWTDDAVLDRPTRLPWGELSGRMVLATYTNEITVHTWDLARGTGQEPAWDRSVLEVAFAAIRATLPAEGRSEAFEAARELLPPEVPFSVPFAAAVPVPDDAPLVDRLVAWNGRDPGWG